MDPSAASYWLFVGMLSGGLIYSIWTLQYFALIITEYGRLREEQGRKTSTKIKTLELSISLFRDAIAFFFANAWAIGIQAFFVDTDGLLLSSFLYALSAFLVWPMVLLLWDEGIYPIVFKFSSIAMLQVCRGS